MKTIIKILRILTQTETLITLLVTSIGSFVWWQLEASNNEAQILFWVSISSFIVLLTTRRFRGDSIYYNQFRNHLRQIENLAERLHPYTALEELESFNRNLDVHSLSKTHQNEIISLYHFVKGQCLIDTQENKKEGFEELVKAHKNNLSSLLMKEKALTSYFYLEDLNSASKLIDDILNQDPYNPRAWVIKSQLENLELKDIPHNVKEKTDFKHLFSIYLIKNRRYSDVKAVVSHDWEVIETVKITKSNFKYYCQLAFFYYNDFHATMTFYIDMSQNKSLVKHELLTKINHLLKKLDGNYGMTELFQKNPYYRQVTILLNFTDFYLNNEKDAIIRNYEVFKEGYEYNENGLVQMALALAQIEEYEKVFVLCNTSGKPSLQLYLIKAECHQKLTQIKEALLTYEYYFEKTSIELDFTEMKTCLVMIDLAVSLNVNPEEYYSRSLSNKSFQKTHYKSIVECYALRFDKTNDEIVRQKMEELLKIGEQLDKEEIFIVCIILATFNEFDKCKSLLEPIIDINKESRELRFYIEILYKSRKFHNELLECLEIWNTHFLTDEQLVHWEMDLRYSLGDYKRVKNIGEIGFDRYPKNGTIYFYLILALFRLEETEKLKHLIVRTPEYDFNYRVIFQIASIARHIGESKFAYNLAYNEVKKNPDNITVKEAYFGLLVKSNDRQEEQPIKAEVNTTVRVRSSEGDIKLIHLTDEQLQNNWMAKSFLEKKVGDKVSIQEPLTMKLEEYEVTQIMNKYTGLVAEITDEIHQGNKLQGYNIVSVRFPSDNIQEFEKTLKSTFGFSGEERHSHIQESLTKYENGQIFYSQLVNGVSPENPLLLYEHLTFFGKWLRIPSINHVKGADYSGINEYVVDITALPSLYDLTEYIDIENTSLIVSSFLIEHLKEKINEIDSHDGELMTLSIRMNEVRPQITSKAELQNRRKKYVNYLEWIDKYCRVEYAPNKLDIIEQMDRHDWSNWYFNYWIDVVFLSNQSNRCLVTNDEATFKMFFQQSKPMTTEYFSRKFRKGDLVISRYFLQNRYVGVSISAEILKDAFESNRIIEQNYYFKNCINALNYNFHLDKNVIFDGIIFLKYLYSLSHNLKFKNSIAETVMVECLRSYPMNLSLPSKLSQQIRKEFRLLGTAEIEVMKVIEKVLSIFDYHHETSN